MLATDVIRVCNVCGIEKPIDEFYEVYGKGRWRLACKKCCIEQAKLRYKRRRDEVLLRLHNKRLNPEYRELLRERSSRQNTRIRANNLDIYGVACSPEYTTKVRENQRQKRAENKRMFGYAYPMGTREKRRLHFLELRAKALEYYGGKCECCGKSRYEMLTFDHKVKTYYKDKVRGVALVYEVIREYETSGYPNDKYRILCWNCNVSRGYYGYCPHTGLERELSVDKSRLSWRSKLEMITAYGGECELCGETIPEFLTIDHINGNGNKHRQQVGTGHHFRLWLKQQGYPKNGYRLLCANCNCSEKRNKWTSRQALEEVQNG